MSVAGRGGRGIVEVGCWGRDGVVWRLLSGGGVGWFRRVNAKALCNVVKRLRDRFLTFSELGKEYVGPFLAVEGTLLECGLFFLERNDVVKLFSRIYLLFFLSLLKGCDACLLEVCEGMLSF